MKRRTKLLSVCLAISVAFAAWSWLRPYELGADKQAARYEITHASVRQDHANYWLDLYLQQAGPEGHDLMKPVALLMADGREMEPADIDLSGDEKNPMASIRFKFWLQAADFSGPLRLKLNDGELSVRTKSGPPPARTEPRFFNQNRW